MKIIIRFHKNGMLRIIDVIEYAKELNEELGRDDITPFHILDYYYNVCDYATVVKKIVNSKKKIKNVI